MKPFILFNDSHNVRELDYAPEARGKPFDAYYFDRDANTWWRKGAMGMWSQVHPEDVPGEYKVWLLLL